MKRILIVTPRWIPLAAPEMQRIRMSLPYYRASGWEPIILCVDPTYVPGTRESELAATIPDDVVVYRCNALPHAQTRWLGVGSLGLRSVRNLWRAGTGIIEREKIDLVFLSTTEFVTFGAARLWRRQVGIPYVLDIQDPWRTSHYEHPGAGPPPGGWKYRFARAVAWMLEGWSFAGASGLVSVSPLYLETLRARYPHIASVPSAVIPFGASKNDWEYLRQRPGLGTSGWKRKDGYAYLVYTGASGPISPHAVETLFASIAHFSRDSPAEAKRLRLHFIGTSYAPLGEARPTITAYAKKWGIESLVVEVPHRVSHFDSLRAQSDSDGLLLLGSIDPAYSPSKLYTYFLSRKPVLALVYRGSHLESLLHSLRCAQVTILATTGVDEQIYLEIAAFLRHALAGFRTGPPREHNDTYFQAELAPETLTQRQCALFDRALAHKQAVTPSSTP